MEEKESPISGSPENTESGSPTPISSSVVSAPLEAGSGDGGINGGALVLGSSANLTGSKKKRGRPRKYDAHGNLHPSYANIGRKISSPPSGPASPPPGFTLTPSFPAENGPKRGRGRASPQNNWNQLSPTPTTSGGMFPDTSGMDFTPHVIAVQPGEDVATKIFSVGHNKGPRAVCVLSANGSISNVTIRQPGSASGGLLTYEGRFEILSLSGSYTISEANGVTTRNGGLSISLAGPDGRVVGGSVAGWLIAATPIQMVVGSFVPCCPKAPKRRQHRESSSAAARSATPTLPDTMAAQFLNPQSVPLNIETSAPDVSPMPLQSHSEPDDSIGSGHNLNVVSSYDTPEWNNGSSSQQQRMYPDINVSLPGV